MESMGIFQLADRTLCPKIDFCVQCYSVLSFSTANYFANGVNLLNILNKIVYLYQKEAALVMCLVVQLQTAQIRLVKFV